MRSCRARISNPPLTARAAHPTIDRMSAQNGLQSNGKTDGGDTVNGANGNGNAANGANPSNGTNAKSLGPLTGSGIKGELVLLDKSIHLGWLITPESRAKSIARLEQLRDNAHDERVVCRAIDTLAKLDALNVARERTESTERNVDMSNQVSVIRTAMRGSKGRKALSDLSNLPADPPETPQ